MTVLLAVTLVSLALAVVMSAVAWRVARNERAREAARVAALAVDIQQAVAAAGGRRSETPLRAVPPPSATTTDLFAAPASSTISRSVVGVGLGLFAFATIAALVVVLTSRTRPANATDPTYPTHQTDLTHPTDPTHQTPLDLVALGHERQADRLIVRGVVRNVASARTEALTAVVFAFDRDGGFVTSGRAAVDTPQLAPGGDSTFSVTLPHAERVVRYRVSFRTDAGIVPHVDRRQGS